jgi:hypothetical protein
MKARSWGDSPDPEVAAVVSVVIGGSYGGAATATTVGRSIGFRPGRT